MEAGTQQAEQGSAARRGRPRICVASRVSNMTYFAMRRGALDFYPYMRTLRRERARVRRGGLRGLLARRSHELRLER